jgi:hypothetical protein
MAYDQLEPFGEGRLVLQLAMMLRQNAGSKADLTVTDLVPYFVPPPPEPATELDDGKRAALSARMSAFFKAKAGIE